jgi:hypothetical protein
MKVFIVTAEIDYGPSTCLGVFSNRELAEKYKDFLRIQGNFGISPIPYFYLLGDVVFIEEFILDEHVTSSNEAFLKRLNSE